MQNWSASATPGLHSETSLPTILSGIKVHILFILTVSLLAILFLTFAWLRFSVQRINVPVYAIRRAVYRLAQGKLNETVSIDSNDEFGQIGANINELAANLQELLLYIWKQTGQCISHLDEIKGHSNQNDDLIRHIHELTSAVENLREMAKAYVFYDVRLDGEKTLAINNPGQEMRAKFPKDLPGAFKE